VREAVTVMPRLSYTNVTATIALVAALSGSAYAAATFTGADVRNGSLTGADLRDGSVTGRDTGAETLSGSDLASGALGSAHLAEGSLAAADVAPGQGPAGHAGPPGPAGPAGAQGPTGTTQLVTRLAREEIITSGQNLTATASCLAGEVAVGGGAGLTAQQDDLVGIKYDRPLEADGTTPEDGERATQWEATGENSFLSGLPSVVMTVSVLCAKE
jgi:hypothetical protein